MTELMFLCQRGIWPILCQLMAILAKLLDMDFKFAGSNFGLKFFGGLNKKNRPCLVCAKSIFTLILNVLDKFIEKCRRSRIFGE